MQFNATDLILYLDVVRKIQSTVYCIIGPRIFGPGTPPVSHLLSLHGNPPPTPRLFGFTIHKGDTADVLGILVGVPHLVDSGIFTHLAALIVKRSAKAFVCLFSPSNFFGHIFVFAITS
jgi:hypothetical protein